MKFSLIVCTYMRPDSLLRLLQSVQEQNLYPDEILIIDGSLNKETEILLRNNEFKNLKYFLVSDDNRGLTRQRNFGISKIDISSEIVCFLDDDTVLEKDYFVEILNAFLKDQNVVGVGGVAINEYKWRLQEANVSYDKKKYYLLKGIFIKKVYEILFVIILGLGLI